jgi:cytochrome c oxidase subunit 1
MVVTAVRKKAAEDEQVVPPVAESIHDPQQTPAWLDRWVVWLVVALALLLIAYGPNLFDQFSNMELTSPGFTPW